MNWWLRSAAALAICVGLAHSYLGERYILIRLFRRTPLPPLFGSDVFTRRTIRFAWHLTSVAWWGAAVLFWALGRGDAALGLRVLSGTFLVTALITAAGSRGRHLAWPVFLAIAVAVWMGAART
jgi:hypothetical protein